MRISYWSSDVCSSDLDFGIGQFAASADEHAGHEGRKEAGERMHRVDISRKPRRRLRLPGRDDTLRLQPAERTGAATSLCRYQRLRDLGEAAISKRAARTEEAAIALAITTLAPRNRPAIEPVDPAPPRPNTQRTNTHTEHPR